jgi:hypothetical protein
VLRRVRVGALLGTLIAILAFTAIPASAQNIRHFGKNRLQFERVDPALLPGASGSGLIEYKGSKEPSSRWRASLEFAGLTPGETYTVVILGRFGKGGSAEADSFTSLCSFTADTAGEGGCFWYFRGLARLNLVQLRSGNENGTPVLQATRSDGPGSIKTEENRFSPGGEVSGHKNK